MVQRASCCPVAAVTDWVFSHCLVGGEETFPALCIILAVFVPKTRNSAPMRGAVTTVSQICVVWVGEAFAANDIARTVPVLQALQPTGALLEAVVLRGVIFATGVHEAFPAHHVHLAVLVREAILVASDLQPSPIALA